MRLRLLLILLAALVYPRAAEALSCTSVAHELFILKLVETSPKPASGELLERLAEIKEAYGGGKRLTLRNKRSKHHCSRSFLIEAEISPSPGVEQYFEDLKSKRTPPGDCGNLRYKPIPPGEYADFFEMPESECDDTMLHELKNASVEINSSRTKLRFTFTWDGTEYVAKYSIKCATFGIPDYAPVDDCAPN